MGPIVRILIRVACGYAIGQQWITEETAEWLTTDPDVVAVVIDAFAYAVWGAMEIWYALAKRYGWQT